MSSMSLPSSHELALPCVLPPLAQVQNKLLTALILCLIFMAIELAGGYYAHRSVYHCDSLPFGLKLSAQQEPCLIHDSYQEGQLTLEEDLVRTQFLLNRASQQSQSA